MIFNRFYSLLAVLCLTAMAYAQRPFEGLYTNNELSISCQLNLYEDDIPVPGLELDSCYGYIRGSINGLWVILKVNELDESKALVRAVSERGGDAQDLELTLTDEGDIALRQKGDTNIKGVSKSKYVKLPKTLMLMKMGRKQP